MIIRRQLYSDQKLPVKKAHNSGMELKPIFKKIAPAPVNKLLHTATAGGSILRDVEDLLKPIQHQQHLDDAINSSQSLKERTERNLWRNDEVMEMLYTMQELKALEKLNDKTVKSENVFKDVEVVMHRNGFMKKSHVQIWTKWKFLKSTYMTSRRNGVIPRMVPPQVYDTIHKMIVGLNQSINDSCSSVDGDNSSASGMVISGVEGGVSDVQNAAAAAANGGEEEDSFGMAHPIFGFRLGMVKSEPEDNGYEPVENNNSDKDPLEDEQSNGNAVENKKEENKRNKLTKVQEPLQKSLEIPHRGRGRPPKNPPTATSTPHTTPTPVPKPAQMPPLRVAPFAKAINNTNPVAVNRPPPPLTMPPTPRIRVANLNNLKTEDPSRFAQPKLTPKPTHHNQMQQVQQVRLAKEVNTQTRASSTPSPSYPKMKQIPMRKTPYSLRPDRAIPDLDASLSPPPPPLEKLNNKRLEEVANTRQLILQSNNPSNQQNNNNNNRKRRLEMPQDPLMGKQVKYGSPRENDNTKSFNNSNNSTEDSKNYTKVLKNVIVDLSMSLRKMQSEMMQDFFDKQNELLEREHRFQMQQDHMLMKAFQEQTQEIMSSVKQLVGNLKPNNKNEAKLNGKNKMQHKRQQPQQRNQEPEEDDIEDEEQMPSLHMEQDQDEQEPEEDDEEQDHQMEDDIYSEGEEHDEEHDEDNEEQEEITNNTHEEEDEDNDEQHQHQHEDEDHSQTTDDQPENGLNAEENDDSNDSADEEQNPLI